jgi:carbon-monoxide dehydrogenase small subunit
LAAKVRVSATVNGVLREAEVEPRLLLVHFLRENLGLTGTHVGCDTSNCSACAVLMDGKPVKSCTVLAAQADGKDITTVEGLSYGGEPSALQKAFLARHGLQCGFCTPGMLISAHALLKSNPSPTEDDIRKAISGNICRCTGYVNVVEAVLLAARETRKRGR